MIRRLLAIALMVSIPAAVTAASPKAGLCGIPGAAGSVGSCAAFCSKGSCTASDTNCSCYCNWLGQPHCSCEGGGGDELPEG